MLFFTILCVSLASQAYALSLEFLESRSDESLSRRAGSTIFTNLEYDPGSGAHYVFVSIGSGTRAPQSVKMAVTSNAFTWVPGPLPSSTYCVGNSTWNPFDLCTQSAWSGIYNPALSSTFSNTTSAPGHQKYDRDFNISYINDVSQLAAGYYATDDFTIGQAIIDTVRFGIGHNYTIQSELGLGPSSGSGSPPSIIEVMYTNQLIDIKAYGIYLNDFDATIGGALLSIGSVDTSKYIGDLITFDTSGTAEPNIPLQSLELGLGGKTSTLVTNVSVDIDFSTSYIEMPPVLFNGLVKAFNCDLDDVYEAYLCDCSERWSNNSMIFVFENVTINLNASQFIVPAVSENGDPYPPGNGTCTLLAGINDDDDSDFNMILGKPFVRAAYIVHDFTNNQTSLAPARLNSTGGDNIVPLASGGVRATFNASTTSPSVSTTPSPTAPSTSSPAPTLQPSPPKKSNIGAIVGGVVGGVVVICAIALALFIRHRKTKQTTDVEPTGELKAELPADTSTKAHARKDQLPPSELESNQLSPSELESNQFPPQELSSNGDDHDPWGKGLAHASEEIVKGD